MNKPKAPCYGCEERTAECHGSCERYLEYSKAQSEYKRAENKHKREAGMYYTKVEWTPSAQKNWREHQCKTRGRKHCL